MTYLLRLSAFLFVLLSFNAKALVINGCTIEPNTYCLSNADLSYFDLSYADLSGADLAGVDLRNTTMTNVGLDDTDLSGAVLTGADLTNAFLWNADLTDADLTDAGMLNIFVGGTTYNDQTIFPANFDPAAGGMIFISEVPLPAGIYLFLSGLVGLGLLRKKLHCLP